MPESPAPRRVADSLVEMTEIVLPEDTNAKGSAFGGRILALIDKCAAVVAIRHARASVVTASVDSVVFLNKVALGNVLLLSGRINAAFRSSMEIEVRVQAENPLTGSRTLTTCALATFVAVDDTGRPIGVPALELASDAERERSSAAHKRRQARLATRAEGGQS